MQVEILPTPRLDGQAAGSSVRQGASPGVKLNPEPNRPVEDERRADQLAASSRRIVTQISAGPQSQRVRDRHQAGWTPQLGDQDGSIWLIALAGLDHFVRRDRETATSGVVKEAAKQRLGVKARKAQPWDAAVKPDQRRRRPVTDEPHVLEREVTVSSAHRAKRRISVKHCRSISLR
jgi:hypothetical protein